jgi:hypothetical protein
MAYLSKIVLQLPLSNPHVLPEFVETCLRDKVSLIAVWGPGCSAMEDQIDALVIGDGSDGRRFVCTTAHEGETLEDVIEFAETYDGGGAVQLVSL